ncbi:MAG: transcriptional regulator [Acidobacteria bacterium]|nr:MAG: transcriptional regulator [Acidobacteriota bacterium]
MKDAVRYRHGLVCGRFYPPHEGHHRLIETAAARCDRVTVAVLASPEESIPLASRVAWMRSAHAGQLSVRVVGDRGDRPFDPALIEAAVARATIEDRLPPPAARVDAVFSAGPDGGDLCRRLGATHVRVDPERMGAPIRSADVRAGVVGHWRWLRPPVRVGLARRVVAIGSESTGTTTISREIAAALAARGGVWATTRWVAEHGRAYTEEKLAALAAQAAAGGRKPPTMEDLRWTDGDFLSIAERQNADEDVAAAAGSPVLVCDTDAFATGVWYERYLGSRHPGVEAIADRCRHDLYLLTDHIGVPFEQDGLRDGEHLRPWMTRRLIGRMDETGRPWIALRGSRTERFAQGLDAVDRLVAEGWRLAEPLSAA